MRRRTTMAKTSPPEPPAAHDAAKVATVSAACLGAVFALGALGVFNGRVALSVAAGAVIAVANLASLNAIIRAMLQPAVDEAAEAALAREAGTPEDPAAEPEPPPDHTAEGKRGGAAWGLFALLKMVALFGGIWLLLTRSVVDPIPLVVGYGVLPLAIAVSGVVTSLAPRPRGRRVRTHSE
jgi:hypothetical protein